MTGRAGDGRDVRTRSALFGAALGFAASVALLVVLAVGLGSVDIADAFLGEAALGDAALGDGSPGAVLDGTRLGGDRLAERLGGADGPIAERLNERLDERKGEVRSTLVHHLWLSTAAGIVLITATGAAAGWWHGGRLAVAAATTAERPRSRARH